MIKRLSSLLVENATQRYLFSTHLSEENIIACHSLMLMPGIHSILVKNMQIGRGIMVSLINSLDYYRNVGCLSLEEAPQENSIKDVYYNLLEGDYLNNQSCKSMQDFLFEDFTSCDFLWIEKTQELENSLWYSYFYQALLPHANRLPVFILASV
ncbi:hypothetical protein Noda2021_04820 [Candidatus Dependentiae bacterium Noda2021]|nr:hypothetical protein Noda2021_04820 [Candidatus Dependentiae bacterium Noda2021]